VPLESIRASGLSRKQLQKLDRESGGTEPEQRSRGKEETAEERRARKSAVKEERRVSVTTADFT